ncbi:hypothetical protein KUTeg_011682 [Tegillarca granosa]|uniref:Major facilitator superfamily (MFS) profile domain-containing protein n=1 Tax=Tegillarca granosa TaxID=220873 RepID=A0ABQ9EXC7_TEGGR|nr:hypothetical protein KUTeg_011682 [Tegillarca granosa]
MVSYERYAGMAKDVDGGWAWIVLAASVFSFCNASLLTYNVGLINISLLEKYEGNIATTSLIGSIFLTLFSMMSEYFLSSFQKLATYLTKMDLRESNIFVFKIYANIFYKNRSPLASLLVNAYSCRVVHVFGGILMFVGFSARTGICFCYVVLLIVQPYNFKKYVGVAIGCSMFGSGCGMLSSGPVTQYLFDTYNLQGSFLIMGGLGLNQVVFGLFMRPTSIEKHHQQERKNKRQNRRFVCADTCQLKIFKNKSFPIILISGFLWNTPYAIMIFHLPYLAVLQGASHENAAFLVTVLGTGSTVGRFLTGIIAGPQGVDPLLLFLGFIGILGVLSLTFILFATSQVGILIFGFLFGIYSGGVIAIKAPLLSNLVGMQYMSTGIGLFCLLECPGFLAGPPLAGYIVDMTGSYEFSLYLSGGMFLVACLFSLVSSIWREESEQPLNIETIIPEDKPGDKNTEIKSSSSRTEIIPEERKKLTDDAM